MNPLTMPPLSSMFLVAAGGALGCVLRFVAMRSVSALHAGMFPLGTMLVNILGSLLIGLVLAKYGQEHSVRALIVTGVLGGFTTFSAFSWDALQLLQRGQLAQAAFYMAGSVGLSLAAVALGYQLVK